MFQFKQFTIQDDCSSLKVGTDAVLLGAWAHIPEQGRIIDVGCGCGVITLMAAQRAPKAEIIGIDIHEPSVEQAIRNAAESPFNHVAFRTADFLTADLPHPVDAIISNPPYHTETLQAPSSARAAARSEEYLPFPAFIDRTHALLTCGGHLEVILPMQAHAQFQMLCVKRGLELSRCTLIRTTPRKDPKRVLFDFIKGASPTPTLDEIILLDETGLRSKTYSELCREFYL